MNKSIIKLSCFIALSCFFISQANAQTKEAKETITLDELKNHMYFLASDFLGGRVSYESGYDIAAEYCASQFKSMGLLPVMKDKKGKPTYFQEVPIKKRSVANEFTVSLITSKDTTVLQYNTDLKIPDPLRYIPNEEYEVVFAGYGIEEPSVKWNDFAKIDVANKIVIILVGAPKKDGKNILPDSINKKYQGLKGVQIKYAHLYHKKAAAIIIIPDNEILTQIPWTMLPNIPGGNLYQSTIQSNKEEVSNIPTLYIINPESVKKIFKNQTYSPETIETKGLKGYKTYTFKDVKIKPKFKAGEETIVYSKNIVAVLKGSDPVLSNEYVTVTAHLDHVPKNGTQVCNGADDNSSGVIGVMEIAEAMVMQPAKRSVMFILFCGEELGGLVGSSYFVNNSPVQLENIVVNINLDMISRTTKENMSNRAHYITLHQQWMEPVKNIVDEVNTNSVKWPLIYQNVKDMGGDSDHTSFNSKGIPNMHFFSGSHADLHMPSDDAEKVDFDKMQKLIFLIYDLTYKIGNLDQLPFKKK